MRGDEGQRGTRALVTGNRYGTPRAQGRCAIYSFKDEARGSEVQPPPPTPSRPWQRRAAGSSHTKDRPLRLPAEGNPRRQPRRTEAASGPEPGSQRGRRSSAHEGRARPAGPLTSSFRERLDTFFSILAAVFSAPRPFFSFLPFLPIVPVRGGPGTPRLVSSSARRTARRKYVFVSRRAEVRHFRDAGWGSAALFHNLWK